MLVVLEVYVLIYGDPKQIRTGVLQDFQLPNITSVFTSKPHRRLYRARYPNSDPEIDQWGYDSSQKLKYSIAADVVEEWIKPRQPSLY